MNSFSYCKNQFQTLSSAKASESVSICKWVNMNSLNLFLLNSSETLSDVLLGHGALFNGQKNQNISLSLSPSNLGYILIFHSIFMKGYHNICLHQISV